MSETNIQQAPEPPLIDTEEQAHEKALISDIISQQELHTAAAIAAKEILGEPNPSEKDIEYVSSLFTKHSKVATIEGQVAACIAYSIDDTGTNAELEILATDTAFKRQGLAKKLLGEAELEMIDLGVSAITLRSTKAGLPFYTAMGYRADSTVADSEDLYLHKDL